MNSSDYENRLREMEYFHSLQVPRGNLVVLRVDGRSFSRLTAECFEKPFDAQFHRHMIGAAEALLTEFQAPYAYTQSDEISVLLPREFSFFDREVEKLVSISASIAASTFTHNFGTPVQFDSRIWMAAREEDVIDYFRWRQADAARCALNGWCYWTLRKEGMTQKQATARISGVSNSEKNEILFQRGINFNGVPLWQRRGTGLYWEAFEKEGLNPMTGKSVAAVRRRIQIDEELPMKDEYEALVRQFLLA